MVESSSEYTQIQAYKPASCDGYTEIRKLAENVKSSQGKVVLVEKDNQRFVMKILNIPENNQTQKKWIVDRTKYECEVVKQLHDKQVEGIPNFYEFQ